MTDTMKRDNSYVLSRLKKIGREDLIEQIRNSEMTVYAASIEAGFRKKRSAASKAAHLSYHWSRAGIGERKRFLIDNFKEIDELRKELVKMVQDKAQKTEK